MLICLGQRRRDDHYHQRKCDRYDEGPNQRRPKRRSKLLVLADNALVIGGYYFGHYITPNLKTQAPASRFRRPRSLQRRSRRRWFPMMRCLFVRISETKEPAFLPRSSEDSQPRRKRATTGKTHRNRDRRKAGRRRIDL